MDEPTKTPGAIAHPGADNDCDADVDADSDVYTGRQIRMEGGLIIPELRLEPLTDDGLKMLALQGIHRGPCTCIACRGEGLPETFMPEEEKAIADAFAYRAKVEAESDDDVDDFGLGGSCAG